MYVHQRISCTYCTVPGLQNLMIMQVKQIIPVPPNKVLTGCRRQRSWREQQRRMHALKSSSRSESINAGCGCVAYSCTGISRQFTLSIGESPSWFSSCHMRFASLPWSTVRRRIILAFEISLAAPVVLCLVAIRMPILQFWWARSRLSCYFNKAKFFSGQVRLEVLSRLGTIAS